MMASANSPASFVWRRFGRQLRDVDIEDVREGEKMLYIGRARVSDGEKAAVRRHVAGPLERTSLQVCHGMDNVRFVASFRDGFRCGGRSCDG